MVMVMVNVDLYSAIITKVSNAIRGVGSAVSSPSGVRGETRGKCGFGAFLGLKNQVISTFHSWLAVSSFPSSEKFFISQSLGVNRPLQHPLTDAAAPE